REGKALALAHECLKQELILANSIAEQWKNTQHHAGAHPAVTQLRAEKAEADRDEAVSQCAALGFALVTFGKHHRGCKATAACIGSENHQSCDHSCDCGLEKHVLTRSAAAREILEKAKDGEKWRQLAKDAGNGIGVPKWLCEVIDDQKRANYGLHDDLMRT